MNEMGLFLSGLVLFAAAVIQGAAGLGYALFATPMLIWAGIPLDQVVVMVAVGSMIQCATGVRHLSESVPWRPALLATALRLIFVLVGVSILKRLILLDPVRLRLSIGCLLCLLVAVQYFWRPHPVHRVHPGWTFFAFSSSGLLAGMTGMGGPPLALWVMAHNWSQEKTRGFFFATFLTFIPLQLIMLFLTPGLGPLGKALLTAVAFSPLILLGSYIGLAAGKRISKKRLCDLIYICLLVSGVSAVVSAWQATASQHGLK
jgi:uncharacterized membrane protein YfcA